MSTEFLIKEYRKDTPSSTTMNQLEKPKIRLVNLTGLFCELNAAKEDGSKIAIYEIGDCVLDWS